jgi:hypothetical protein
VRAAPGIRRRDIRKCGLPRKLRGKEDKFGFAARFAIHVTAISPGAAAGQQQ